MKKMITRAASALLAVSLAAGLAGCGASGTTSASSAASGAVSGAATDAAASSTATSAPVTLTLAAPNSWNTDGLKTAIRMYEEKTGNTIEVELVPDDQQKEIFNTRLATGADVPDLLAYQSQCGLGHFDYPNQFVPLEGDWIKNLPEQQVKDSYQAADGKMYFVPYGSCTNISIIYNKEIFKEVGITQPVATWTDFQTACEKIKAAGYTPITISNKENWTAQMLWISAMDGIFKDIPDKVEQIKAGKLAYNDVPEMKEALDKLYSLVENGYVNEDQMSTTMDMALEAVATKKSAMTPAGDWSYSAVEKNYPDAVANIGMMPFTLRDDFMSIQQDTSSKGMGVPLKGKHNAQDAAVDFVNFLVSDEVMNAMYETDPGISPYTTQDTKRSSWNQEMSDYAKDYPLSQTVWKAFDYGDQATAIQSLFSGKSSEETLKSWYESCANNNKAKGTPGF